MPETRTNKVLFGGLAVVASSLVFVLYLMSGSKDELALHLGKVLIQFVVLLVVGALIGDYFKRLENRRREDEKLSDIQRREERHLAAFREEVRKRLSAAYQSAKRSRTKLRAAGLTLEHCDGTRRMTKDEAQIYRAEMEQLNDVQLDIEKLLHEVQTFSHVFTQIRGIRQGLRTMSIFLLRVVGEYEKVGCDAVEGSEVSLPKLENLAEIIRPSTSGGFREKYCDQYSEVADLIRQDELRASAS